MKKIIAAALSVLVGAFGFTIVDKTIEQRVSDLECSMSSLVEENNSLYELSERTHKVGDEIEFYVSPVHYYYFDDNDEVIGYDTLDIFDDLNVTAKIIEIETDKTSIYYYTEKYKIQYTIEGTVNSTFYEHFRISSEFTNKEAYGFCLYAESKIDNSYCTCIVGKNNNHFSKTYEVRVKEIAPTYIYIGGYT